MVAILGTGPNISKLCVLLCAAFIHKHYKNRCDKFEGRTGGDVYVANDHRAT